MAKFRDDSLMEETLSYLYFNTKLNEQVEQQKQTDFFYRYLQG